MKVNTPIDIENIRSHFPAIQAGRLVFNNGSSTQMPEELLTMQRDLALTYENVHRGLSAACIRSTALFENAYQVIANFVGARSWEEIILYRGTTEAINAVMYSLMTEFRDGDNVVTTMMEHNSNYVPWYGMTHEILPRFGVNVECRLARFDKKTGELDIDHLASLVDKRTKLVCCTGASNFQAVKPPLDKVREIAGRSGYEQPNGIKRSYMLVDGAQLVPNAPVDVERSDLDFLAWSFHKMLAPVGVGALYARKEILESLRPFQYGGDMIEKGKVTPELVGYNVLPWKFTAGTPNIMGTVMAGEATEFLVDSVLGEHKELNHRTIHPLYERGQINKAMQLVANYEEEMGGYLLNELSGIGGLTIYGPKDRAKRTALVSFTIQGKDPMKLAEDLTQYKIETRVGDHCASLAHYYYDLKPQVSCRISPYIYNTMGELETVVRAVKEVAAKEE
jgi:cysteine desulfurase / selenocysteine lyase